jgi:DNA-binding Xre family transcriptional regulator
MLKDVDNQREFRRQRGARVEAAMYKKKMNQQQLATASGHDVRTVRILLKGNEDVRPQIVIDICEALEIEPELYESSAAIQVADLKYGSYARDPYKHYEGAYFAYRRSFSVPGVFVRSIFEIKWADTLRVLAFREVLPHQINTTRTVAGEVYISQDTNLIHFVTVIEGSVRTITLHKMRDGIMRGSIMWQTDRETYFQPAFSAFYLEKILGFESDSHTELVGLMRPDDLGYDRVSREMALVEKNVVAVATPA